MNNYYTLIYLNRELNGNILGGQFDFAISPHKDVLECYIKKEDASFRLIFSANSSETALFMDDYRPPKKRNVLDFFKTLEGQEITDIKMAKFDRLMYFHFENGCTLLFKLFGNDANAMLMRDDTIIDAFKHPEEIEGKHAPEPQAPDFDQTVTAKANPKNQLTRINPLLPRNLLPALIRQHKVDEMSLDEVKAFTKKITHALQNDPHPRVLKNGDVCLWEESILHLPTEESFDSVNKCVRYAYRNAVHLRRLHNTKERLLSFLRRALKKKEAQLEQLRQADKSLARADEYEKFGHILMANAHKSVAAGTSSIQLDDIYENDSTITIPLKEGCSIADNAQRFYDKAKASRRSFEKAKERIPAVENEINQLETLVAESEQMDRLYNLERWIKDHGDELEKYGYGTEDEGQAKSPFRKFKVGKYEVWVGKNAKSNDQLTSHAHKEDIWLHARGVSGSHVVIRMGNEKSFPPKNIILQAAGYAVYYSKAKGMQTAPVSYTKRKYIHKPKGAPPGAVVLDREEVEMVPPTQPS